MNKKYFIILILFGLLIRLLFINLPPFRVDMDAWFSWAIRLNQVGFSNFYSNQIWTNYTPGFLYILGGLGYIKNLFHLNNDLLYLMIKIPSILAEIFIGFLIYKISKKDVKWTLICCSIIFLNPAFIFNSSIWGQIDGFLSLFMILSIYFLEKKKFILSSILLGLALLIKPQAIALLPMFGLYSIRNFSIKNIIQIVLPGTLTVFILSFPFFIKDPIWGLVQLFSKMVSDYPYSSLFAYNVWGSVGFWINDSTGSFITYHLLGYVLFGLYWLLLIFLYLRNKLSLLSTSTLGLLAFFFLPTRVHERYLYPSLVFLIFQTYRLKNKVLLSLTILLSFIHLLNLYYVYIYYNEIYLEMDKVLYNEFLYNLLNSNGRLLSIISTIIFITISFVIIKSNDSKQIKS